MAYKFKKKKEPKEDRSEEFEKYMIKEWYWYRDEKWLHDDYSKKWFETQESIISWFEKYLNNRNYAK